MSANSFLWGARAVGLPRALPRGGGTAQFEAVSPHAWTTGRGRRPPSESPEPPSPAQLGAPEAEAPRQTSRKGTVRSHTGPTNPVGPTVVHKYRRAPISPAQNFSPMFTGMDGRQTWQGASTDLNLGSQPLASCSVCLFTGQFTSHPSTCAPTRLNF